LKDIKSPLRGEWRNYKGFQPPKFPQARRDIYFYLVMQGACQRFALPALGRGRRSRPTRKMIRRVKLLEMCAESPASGARFVGWRLGLENNFI